MPTAPTAQTLVRELGARMGEYILSSPAGTGSATTLVDQALLQYWPQDVQNQLNAWVYGATDADSSNRAVERRIASWVAATYTATFYGAGFPVAVTTGHYEIRTRHSRARMLEAINTGVRELNYSWYRHAVDTSITTQQNQWLYTLPTGTLWTGGGYKAQLQINTDTTLGPSTTIAAGSDGAALPQSTINVASTIGFLDAGSFQITLSSGVVTTVGYTGITATTFTGCTGGSGTLATGNLVSLLSYPYIDSTDWDVAIYPQTDTNGVTLWQLQFAALPPPGRTIRLFGNAGFTDLVSDTDILALDASTAGMAYEWLMKNASFQLWLWEGNKQPAGQTERIIAWAKTLREDERMFLVEHRPVSRNSRIVVPGRGTGTFPGGSTSGSSDWLAAYRDGF